MKKLSKLNKQYVAGIFDFRGSVTINRNRNTHFHEIISLTDKNHKTIHRLASMFGGSVYPGVGNNTLKWVISGSNVDFFMKNILPFIRTKRAKFDIINKFRKIRTGQTNHFDRQARKDAYANLYNKIRTV